MEAQIALVAAGKAERQAVVQHTLAQFTQKFLFFVENISRMDSLFEASFSPLTASGAPSPSPRVRRAAPCSRLVGAELRIATTL